MKIAVMGAGAVGCYYGFKLARAGHDAVLIGRRQHVEAIERQGLRLETQTFDEHIRVTASTEGSAAQGAQLVLFCVPGVSGIIAAGELVIERSKDNDDFARADRSGRADRYLRQRARRVVGEANHELRVQRAIGDGTIAYGRLVMGESVTVVLRDATSSMNAWPLRKPMA